MFRTTAEFTMDIPTELGVKKAIVRWPSDEEWSDRSRERKIFLRGGSVERIESEKADLALFDKISAPDSTDLDEFEAGEVIDRLAIAEVTDCELRETDAEVTLRTFLGETKHMVRIPSIRSKKKAQTAATKLRDQPYGRRLLTTYLEPIAKLYDDAKVSAEGYENGIVPILHKDAVMRGLMEAVDQRITGDSANFQ